MLPALLQGQPKTLVRIYSGSFNTRTPNSTEEDLEAIARMAELLRDTSAFVFRGQHKRLQSIASLWETLDDDVAKVNSLFAEAWHLFAAEFDRRLVAPSHPKLFAVELSPAERDHFDKVVIPLAKDSMAEYCKALRASEYFKKVAEHKRATVCALASGTIDAPICDVLIEMGEYLHTHGHTTETRDQWSCDHKTGFTKVAPTGVCSGLSLTLHDPDSACPVLKRELMKRVLTAIAPPANAHVDASPKPPKQRRLQ